MFKVYKRNTRTKCEICSKLTIKTHQNDANGVFIVNFEQVNASWVNLNVLYTPRHNQDTHKYLRWRALQQ